MRTSLLQQAFAGAGLLLSLAGCQASGKTSHREEACGSEKTSSTEASCCQACYCANRLHSQLGVRADPCCCDPDCNAGNPDAIQSVLIFSRRRKMPGLRRSGIFLRP